MYVPPAVSYYPLALVSSAPGALAIASPTPSAPPAATTSNYPVATQSYLAGFQPDAPAMPAVGATVVQQLGNFLLQGLRSRLAGQTPTTTTTDQTSLFKDLLDSALSLFAQGTGGFQPNSADFRTIVDLVLRVLGERTATASGTATATASGGGSTTTATPSSLIINATSIQVTIPPTANIFLQQTSAPQTGSTQAGGARPADPPPAPAAGANSSSPLGDSGPPAVR